MPSLRKIARGVKKGGKVAFAAGRLTSKLVNPYSRAKFAIEAAKGKGFVLPGSKYIGPGNVLTRGKPTSSADAAARSGPTT